MIKKDLDNLNNLENIEKLKTETFLIKNKLFEINIEESFK